LVKTRERKIKTKSKISFIYLFKSIVYTLYKEENGRRYLEGIKVLPIT
jgi:hypothetical protein